jgi:endoglucanase
MPARSCTIGGPRGPPACLASAIPRFDVAGDRHRAASGDGGRPAPDTSVVVSISSLTDRIEDRHPGRTEPGRDRAATQRASITTTGDEPMRTRPLSWLLLWTAMLAASAAQAATTCTATAITPYIKSGSTWSNTASANVPAVTSLVLGPHPTTGGSWAWSGCGTTGSAREQTIAARSSCTATATYTNTCGAKSTQAFAITVPGMRDLTSLQLSKLMGAGWNLGNSLEAIGGETAWGNPAVNQAMFNAVKAAGFKTVRIPLSWKQYADASDNISATWMARVKQVVDEAHSAGLVTIINIHWDGGWMQPTYAQQAMVNARITKFWTQIANNFKAYDDTLLFAGTNEVMVTNVYSAPTVENQTVQNSFNQTFVNAVRATGGNNAARHLVVQGYNTNIDWTVSYAVVPTDTVASRLSMEVHYYDPYDFTLNTSSNIWQWGAGATDPNATETWANEAYADGQFQKMKTRFVDQGIPVILGEYAAISRTNITGAEAYRTKWDQYIAHSAFTHGAVPVYWDAGATANNGTGLFNRSTGAQAYPALIATIVNAAK